MYKSLEELQKKHPIGSAYNYYFELVSDWCPTKNDILIFKHKHPNAINFQFLENDIITAEEKHENKVEGYIFDGEYWFPAYQSWDGWQIIDKDEIKIEKGIDLYE